MKHVSVRLLLLTLACCITITGFAPPSHTAFSRSETGSSRSETTFPRHALTPSAGQVAKLTLEYYWFVEPSDYFDDYWDVANQINYLETYSGGTVNTNPIGGRLLEYGYSSVTLPHNGRPQVGLYLH